LKNSWYVVERSEAHTIGSLKNI